MNPNEVEVKNNEKRNRIGAVIAGTGKVKMHFLLETYEQPDKVSLFVIVVVCCATLIPGNGGSGGGGGSSGGHSSTYPPTSYTSKPTTTKTTTKQSSIGTIPGTFPPDEADSILVLKDRFS